MGQRTGSAPALVRQPAKPNQRIRRRTMSQRDFFPIACLLRSRMPSADRYFLCLPKLVRQLKSSAPARARISRLHYVFFLADCFAQQKQNEPQKARMGSQKGTKNRFCAFCLPSLIWAKPLSRSTFTCRSLYEVGWGADQTPEAADGVLLLAHRPTQFSGGLARRRDVRRSRCRREASRALGR